METTVEQDSPASDKRKNKKKKKPALIEDDFVIPESAMASAKPTNQELAENTEALTVQSSKKKNKKERNKRTEEVGSCREWRVPGDTASILVFV